MLAVVPQNAVVAMSEDIVPRVPFVPGLPEMSTMEAVREL